MALNHTVSVTFGHGGDVTNKQPSPASPTLAGPALAPHALPRKWTLMLVPKTVTISPSFLAAAQKVQHPLVYLHASSPPFATEANLPIVLAESKHSVIIVAGQPLPIAPCTITLGPLDPRQDAVTITAAIVSAGGTYDATTHELNLNRLAAPRSTLAALVQGHIAANDTPMGTVDVPLRRHRHDAVTADYADDVLATLHCAFIVSNWAPLEADDQSRPQSPLLSATKKAASSRALHGTVANVPSQRKLLDPRSPQATMIRSLPQYTARLLLHDVKVLHRHATTVVVEGPAATANALRSQGGTFFDPSGTISSVSEAPNVSAEIEPTYGHTATLIRGQIYVLGGARAPSAAGAAGGYASTVRVFDPAAAADGQSSHRPCWTVVKPPLDGFAFRRESHSAVHHRGRIVVHGGVGPGGLDRNMTALSGVYHGRRQPLTPRSSRDHRRTSQTNTNAPPASKSVHVIGTSTVADISAIPPRSATTDSGGSHMTATMGTTSVKASAPSGYYDTTLEYDPQDNVWRKLETRGQGRDYRAEHTAVLVQPTRPAGADIMCVFGGWAIRIVESVDVDAATGVETHRYSTTEARTNAVAMLNLQSGEWSSVPMVTVTTPEGHSETLPMAVAIPAPRSGHAAAAIGHRYMIVHGGVTMPSGPNGKLKLLNDTWVFDASALTWREIANDSAVPRPPPRYGHCLSVFGGSILVTGGKMRAGGQGKGAASSAASADAWWQLNVASEEWHHVSLLGLPSVDDATATAGPDGSVEAAVHTTCPRFRGTATWYAEATSGGGSKSLFAASVAQGLVSPSEHSITVVVIGGMPSGAATWIDTESRSTVLEHYSSTTTSRGDDTTARYDVMLPTRCGAPVVLHAAMLMEPVQRDALVAVPPEELYAAGGARVGFMTAEETAAALVADKAQRRAEAERQAQYFEMLTRPGPRVSRRPVSPDTLARKRSHSPPPKMAWVYEPQGPAVLTKEENQATLKRLIDDDRAKRLRNLRAREKQIEKDLKDIVGPTLKQPPEAVTQRMERLFRDAEIIAAKKRKAHADSWKQWHRSHQTPEHVKDEAERQAKREGRSVVRPRGGTVNDENATTILGEKQDTESALPLPQVTPLDFHDDRKPRDDRTRLDDRRRVTPIVSTSN
jgi:hypothetical protein